MSRVDDGVFCTCGCHEPKSGMIHCMPCCAECKYCHRNVHFSALKEHEKDCGTKSWDQYNTQPSHIDPADVDRLWKKLVGGEDDDRTS